MTVIEYFVWLLGVAWLFSWASYFVPQLIVKYRGIQDLRKKYNAKWALVSGGSSGIGRSIVERLASQGISVVVAAFPDKVLDDAVEEYKKQYPKVQFRKVPVNLADAEFLKVLIDNTKDIDVNIVVNNAGYIKTGFFAEEPLAAQLANHNVNATAAMQITHHFVKEMRAKKLKGCVTFTSSPAGFMPCPFSVLYGATKAYLTTFAQSLAPEIHCDGIDVTVVHPSPVASRFYDNAHQIGTLLFFKSTATGPDIIADMLFASVGRVVTVDQGYYPPCVKLMLKLVDVNFMADLICSIAKFLPDFKEMKAKIAKSS